MRPLLVVDIGRTRYADAWELQRRAFTARLEGRIPDLLFLTEHEHVYTLGKGADSNHLLASEAELRERGIETFQIDRGGDVTYHGPGQIVGYPILDLKDHHQDIHRYLRDIEGALIVTLARFGIVADRSDGYTGVWVKVDKIAAIGVKVSRWVTMHGFALNVNTDLSFFERIIPCGIFHRGVTSMAEILGAIQSMAAVRDEIVRGFESVFSVAATRCTVFELQQLIGLRDSLTVEEKV